MGLEIVQGPEKHSLDYITPCNQLSKEWKDKGIANAKSWKIILYTNSRKVCHQVRVRKIKSLASTLRILNKIFVTDI